MDDLYLALSWADAADALTLPAFDRRERAIAKADGTPVTAADRVVERVLRERLAAARPDDGILGEEMGRLGAALGGGCWIRSTGPSGSPAASPCGRR